MSPPSCPKCHGTGTVYGPLDGNGDAGSVCESCPAGIREAEGRLASAAEDVRFYTKLLKDRGDS